MHIEIDNDSGFCFGVVTAITKAEEELRTDGVLYCLGDIVHNSDEVNRLSAKGLRVITHDDLNNLSDVKVLLRAHGEPPSTYNVARQNNISIVDATCPVVLKLQQRIKASYDVPPEQRPQIVIYGKKGHAEVNGLVGQTNMEAVVVESPEELDCLDFSRPTVLYSQTTKSLDGFREMAAAIKSRMQPGVEFHSYDTICRQVANRTDKLRRFAANHDIVLFVAGAKSSNGKVLFNECRLSNPRTFLVSNADDLADISFTNAETIGICGATSTPRWLMEQVRDALAARFP